MNNLKLTKKKDLILVAVIIVIAIVMYIIMNQMQSDNGEIVKITVDGNVYGTYSLTKNQEIEIKTDKGKNIVWIHDNCVEMKEADCPDKYCVKQGKRPDKILYVCHTRLLWKLQYQTIQKVMRQMLLQNRSL